jgi:hypothetical protein
MKIYTNISLLIVVEETDYYIVRGKVGYASWQCRTRCGLPVAWEREDVFDEWNLK